ncbi:MAG: HlyD family efflux transporter periplasmic adaptor subunit, partial [SAR324 cluster bacterium]|nr:HlyD family efflux transporter periplasmic adaptor subunit [SAR324 cluster bacterium]
YFSFLFVWLFGGIFTLWGSELGGSYKTPISLTGLIEPSETLQVQSSIGGRVEAIHVKVNQSVAEDQLLLTIENTSQKRQLELSRIQLKINENNVKVSENSIKDMETNLKDIKRRLDDEETLFEQGSSTRSQLEALQLQYNRAVLSLEKTKLGYENAILTLERSKHDVDLSEDALEDTRVKAKIGGIIVAKSIEEGEMISPGSPVFHIIDISQVKIVIQAEQHDLPMIKRGQSVVFVTPSYRDKQFSGYIERVDWIADPETGRFPLHVKANNPGLMLRAGMSAKVYLLSKR